jgi:WD40 repeat protein
VFSPDGKKLAAAIGAKATVWDSESGKELVALENAAPALTSLAFSPDGKTVAGGIGKTINLWNVESGKVEKTLSGHSVPVTGVGFSADGKTLISSAGQYNFRTNIAEVWLWDVQQGTKIAEIKAGQGMITCLAMSPDHKVAATGSMDGSVRIRDLAQKSDMENLKPGGSIACLAFSPDGKTLAVANTQATIFLYDTAAEHAALSTPRKQVDSEHAAPASDTRKEKSKIEGGEDLIIGSLAFSPDGKFLAGACDDKTIKIWNTATGKLANTLQGHAQTVTAVAYSPKDRLLASGDKDGDIRLWDAATGQSRQTLR